MGTTQYIHIGAYLEIEAEKFKYYEEEKNCENHPGVNFNDKSQFCFECGKPLITKTIEKEADATFNSLLDSDEYDNFEDEFIEPDLFYDNNKLILIGNKLNKLKPDSIIEEKEGYEIDHKMIDQYIQNFKENYSEIINILEKRVIKLEVKFGVVIYYL